MPLIDNRVSDISYDNIYDNEYARRNTREVSAHENVAYLELDLEYPAYLRSLFKTTKLNFTYLPEEISVNGADPNWSEVDIIGRWSPYQIFIGTSAENINFTLSFLAVNDAVSDVKEKIDWLVSLKYPVLYQNVSYRPPSLDFYFGDLFHKKVIVKEATPTYRAPWSVVGDQQPSYPLHSMIAEVSIGLTTVSSDFVSGPNVMVGKY